MVTKKKTTKAAASVATESRAAGAGAVAPVLVDKATTEAALRRVIQLALAMLPDTRDAAKDRPKGESAATALPEAPPPGTGAALPNQARQSLERALDDLDPEVALKLRTLMIAGRDGKSISDVNVNMTLGDSKAAFSAAALDTSHNGALLADYLRKGHALAWATALDIERPLASWAETMPHTLDERAWLSFGKQLAKSDPGDWQCLAFLDGRTQGISQPVLAARRARLVVLSGRAGQAVRGCRGETAARVDEPSLQGRRGSFAGVGGIAAVFRTGSGLEARGTRDPRAAGRSDSGQLNLFPRAALAHFAKPHRSTRCGGRPGRPGRGRRLQRGLSQRQRCSAPANTAKGAKVQFATAFAVAHQTVLAPPPIALMTRFLLRSRRIGAEWI